MLYRDPQHGSPVRGDPGDLLLIPGFNVSPSAYVIYQAIADTTQRLSPPSPLPSGQTDLQVKFLARGSGYSLFLTPAESVLALRQEGGERS